MRFRARGCQNERPRTGVIRVTYSDVERTKEIRHQCDPVRAHVFDPYNREPRNALRICANLNRSALITLSMARLRSRAVFTSIRAAAQLIRIFRRVRPAHRLDPHCPRIDAEMTLPWGGRVKSLGATRPKAWLPLSRTAAKFNSIFVLATGIFLRLPARTGPFWTTYPFGKYTERLIHRQTCHVPISSAPHTKTCIMRWSHVIQR